MLLYLRGTHIRLILEEWCLWNWRVHGWQLHRFSHTWLITMVLPRQWFEAMSHLDHHLSQCFTIDRGQEMSMLAVGVHSCVFHVTNDWANECAYDESVAWHLFLAAILWLQFGDHWIDVPMSYEVHLAKSTLKVIACLFIPLINKSLMDSDRL